MRSRISIRGCVRPSVGRSHTSWIFEKWAKSEQNSIRTKKVCHLKDYSKTSTWAVRQRTHLLSELCSTCSIFDHSGTGSQMMKEQTLTHSLAPPCSLCWRAHSFARSLTLSLPSPWKRGFPTKWTRWSHTVLTRCATTGFPNRNNVIRHVRHSLLGGYFPGILLFLGSKVSLFSARIRTESKAGDSLCPWIVVSASLREVSVH